MAMIEVRELSKRYGTLHVLKGMNFAVAKGEVVVVLGPSGSGKSTLLRCINLLEEFDDGEIRIDDDTIGYRLDAQGRRTRRSEVENARLREQVGMVFQSFNLFPHRTALQNVMMGPVQVRGIRRQQAASWRTPCSPRSGFPTRPANTPPACPAANSSALPSPARSPCSRR